MGGMYMDGGIPSSFNYYVHNFFNDENFGTLKQRRLFCCPYIIIFYCACQRKYYKTFTTGCQTEFTVRD